MMIKDALVFYWSIASAKVYYLIAFGVAVACGIFLEANSTGSSDFTTVLIVIVQMFAVSTGFVHSASRGYYDPVLVRSPSRLALGCVHFGVSAFPGFVAWVLLAILEVVTAHSTHVMALRPGAILTLLVVSAVAWAINLPFAPLSAGGTWFVVGVAFFVSGRFFAALAPVARDPSWSAEHPGRTLFVALIFPYLTPGLSLPPMTLFALAAIAGLAFAAGIFFIHRRDFPLAEES